MIRVDGGEAHEDILAGPADLGCKIGDQQRDIAQTSSSRAFRQDADGIKPPESPSRPPRDLQAFPGSGLIFCDPGYEKFKDVGDEPILALRACSGWKRRSAGVPSRMRAFREPPFHYGDSAGGGTSESN